LATLDYLLQTTGRSLETSIATSKKLREAGIVELRKVFTICGPRTAVQITPIGNRVFRGYAAKLRRLLEKVE
jgi:hypothetical protein